MQRIVFLDRDTVQVPIRRPSHDCEWTDFGHTAPDQVRERSSHAEVVITNKVRLTAEALRQLPALKFVAVAATGFDCVDLVTCRERGIIVSNVPGYSRGSVPEHVFLLILALRRNLPALLQATQAGRWQSAPHFALLDFPLYDIAGSTLGVIGYGDLGQRVANLASALGMKVLIADRKSTSSVRPGRTDFTEVLKQSDVVTLHTPLNAETRGLIGAKELALMKPDALLINTARGGIVDEQALVSALERKALGGAGVDVLTQEPPRTGNPLLNVQLPNLIVTPHVGWASRQAQSILAEEIVKNIEAFTAGKPRNVVS